MSTGMRKWMEKDCPETECLSAQVLIDREELKQLRAELDKYKTERDALRAKIEQMERQEPVAWTTKLALEYGVSKLGFQVSGVNMWGEKGVPLYALPGAQPAPSPASGDVSLISEGKTPTTLLVAVADLVAQMEIVARVGFVDALADKDSCAAFCVAEGSWLELVECVKSLAALAKTALEAQPAPSVPDDVMRDAKRYRFLRAAKNIPISTEAARDPIVYDSAIDAAMLARAPEAAP